MSESPKTLPSLEALLKSHTESMAEMGRKMEQIVADMLVVVIPAMASLQRNSARIMADLAASLPYVPVRRDDDV